MLRVQKIITNTVRWTFDTPVTFVGAGSIAGLRVNGASPLATSQLGGPTTIDATYSGILSLGNPWTAAASPSAAVVGGLPLAAGSGVLT